MSVDNPDGKVILASFTNKRWKFTTELFQLYQRSEQVLIPARIKMVKNRGVCPKDDLITEDSFGTSFSKSIISSPCNWCRVTSSWFRNIDNLGSRLTFSTSEKILFMKMMLLYTKLTYLKGKDFRKPHYFLFLKIFKIDETKKPKATATIIFPDV